MELQKGRFYNVILSCDGYYSQSRAKDVKIIKMSDEEKKQFNYDDINPTHTLVFYDCSCGIKKEIPGVIEKEDDKEIIFAVSKQKKYLIKNIG